LPTGTGRDTTLSSIPARSMDGRVVPGAAPIPRASQPRDTMGIPRSQPTQPSPTPPTSFPPRDTGRVRVDSVKRGGVIIRRDSTRRDSTLQQQSRGRPPR
jgi:hypothetical protein